MEKDKSKQRMASENGRWKGGKSSEFRRRITKAVKGELVHHVDGNKANNSKANFKKLKPSNGISATGKHNQQHLEKSVKGGKAKAKKFK